jgi:endogenous inhibitor of DNA gyrase (YacG/DUF329 family)
MVRPGAMRCPLCHEIATSVATRPFCSERCRAIDIGRWFDGTYRFAGDPVDPAVELGRETAPELAATGDGAKESRCD